MRSARSERALAEGLRRERLVIVKSWRLPSWLATAPGDMPLKDRAEVHQQLSMLLGRGVPLVEALEVTASVVATQTRGTVERMRELVGAGSSFSEACRQVRAFDSVTVAVYQAAEKTGDLAGAADLLATAARRQMAVRGQATGVLAYPVIVFSISVLIVLFMLISVVPQIGEALTNLTTFDELPAITKVVLTASDVLRNNLAAFGIGVLVLFTLLVLGRKIWVPAVNSVVRRLPAMRGLILAQESARFFMVLSAMTRSGVP
ncbi:MAG: type II secretion system F family protein, partial [Planctomycetota bacterium]